MTDTVLRAIDLVMRYKDVRVLNGLNLQVGEGSVFGLIGPNGAGKTTTIKAFMNILTPTRGRCEVLGIDSRELGEDYLAQIGYVSENQEMPGWMTVEYLLSYLKPFYPTWDDGRAKALLRQFKLPLDRKLRDLSRGMWMKASLTSSLAYRPKLLVLDEPFSGLDPLVREELIEGLIDCAEETTILVSSHDLADIESFASHIGYLENGRLQFSEEMASLSARFREVEVTVDPPATVPPAREWPATWLKPEATLALIRFVDSSFEEDRTVFQIRRIFGEVQQISVTPMPLRSIFLTLARGSRL
jgi:ABC-2 type transport system ATP-binding protein